MFRSGWKAKGHHTTFPFLFVMEKRRDSKGEKRIWMYNFNRKNTRKRRGHPLVRFPVIKISRVGIMSAITN